MIFEPAAYSRHIHVAGYGTLRRQSFQGGTSLVRLAEKSGTSVEEIAGNSFDRRTDKAFAIIWAAGPVAARAAGGKLTGLVVVSDSARAGPAQPAIARVVQRFCKTGIRSVSRALLSGQY